MIKRGDKAKGFRFESSSGVCWNYRMEPFVGVEGIVRKVRPKMNELVIGFIGTPIHVVQHWIYPLDECLALQREQRLNEIGI